MAAKRLSAVEVRFLVAHVEAVCRPKGHAHLGQDEVIACAHAILGAPKVEA